MKRYSLILVLFTGSILSSLTLAGSGFGDFSEGRLLFNERCSVCHGMDGRGQGGMAPDFVREWHKLSQPDDVLAERIRGRYLSNDGFYDAGSCPSHNLTDEDIDDLLTYLRQLVDQGGDPFERMEPDAFDRPF